MAAPKRKTPITARKSRADIQKAMANAERMETPHVTPEEGSARRMEPEKPTTPPPPATAPSAPPEKKQVGRKPLIEGRTERLSAFLTPKTSKRLKRAVLQEKLVRFDKGKDVDQSLIVEEALEMWLAAA